MTAKKKSRLLLLLSLYFTIVLALFIFSCIQSPDIQYLIDGKKCVGCGSCIDLCPYDAIHLENNQAVIDYSKCQNCGKCVDACDYDAIK